MRNFISEISNQSLREQLNVNFSVFDVICQSRDFKEMPIKYISSPQIENQKVYSTPTRQSAFDVEIRYICTIPFFLNKSFYVLYINLACVILTCNNGGPQNIELIFLRHSMTAETSNFNIKCVRSRRGGIYFKSFNFGT